jgi:hypothetical protein
MNSKSAVDTEPEVPFDEVSDLTPQELQQTLKQFAFRTGVDCSLFVGPTHSALDQAAM